MNHLRLTIFVAGLVAMQGVWAQQAYDFSPDSVKARLKQDIEVLASEAFEGRESGTPGEVLAAEYIKTRMQEIGLKPVFGDSYFQHFTFSGGWAWGDNNKLEVDGTSFEHGEDFFTLPGSASKELTAQVYDAGNGLASLGVIEYGKEEPDFTGKIYLVEYYLSSEMEMTIGMSVRESVERRIEHAVRKGASGIMFKNTIEGREDPRMDLRVSTDQLDIPAIFVKEDALAHLAENKEKAVYVSTSLERPEVPSLNVAGYIDNNAATTVVIGGHFDHLGYGGRSSRSPGVQAIHYGADDNASGTAGVLEAARYLSNSTLTNNNYLFIAFGAEEKGLVGSRHFTASSDYDISRINYMFNLDMIGRVTENRLSLIGTGSSPVWDGLIERNAPEHLTISKSQGGIGGSDHSAFYLQNIPVIFFFSGVHEDYHMPGDTPDKINYEGAYDVMTFIYSLVSEVNGMDRLAFTRAPESESNRRRTNTPSLGLMPDHTFAGEGLRAQAVIDNRPAKLAGMHDGDVIIRINDIEIREIQTYMEALGKLQRGQLTKVVVKRGDEEITLEVQL